MSRVSSRTCGLWLLSLSLMAPRAMAQEQADAGTEAPPAQEVSPEELEALQKAMSQDVAEQQKTQPAPEPAPAPAPSSGGFSLQSLNPDISFIGDVAAAWFTAGEPYQTGDHDAAANGFTLQQLELAVGKSVDPYFRFDANIVFNLDGVEVEEAYATTLALPAQLQVRAGQFLTRFGRINGTHPHAWAFADQPFAIGRVFGGEASRGVGAEVSWLTPLPWYVELVGSATDANVVRSFFDDAEDARVRTPLDLQYVGALKQFFPLSDDLSLLWGLSAATGPNLSRPHARSNVFGTDVYLKFRPISDPGNPTIVALQAEALYRLRDVGEERLSDVNGYAQLQWQFEKRWACAARYEWGTAAVSQSGAQVEDPLDPDWTGLRQRVAANVTFSPTEFSRLRLQGGTDVAAWRPQPDWLVMLQLEFAVGAHGAHAF